MNESQEHIWFREQIAAALAGGLGAADQVRFDAHAAECAACAAELKASRELEEHMSTLFALPAAGLEDRIIGSLREAATPSAWTSPMRIHPQVRKAATAVAAVIVLGGFGYVVNDRVLQENAPSNLISTGMSLSPRGRGERLYAQGSATPQPAATYGVASNTTVGKTITSESEIVRGVSNLPAQEPAARPPGDDAKKTQQYWDVSGVTSLGTEVAAKPAAPQTNWSKVLNGNGANDYFWQDSSIRTKSGESFYFKPVEQQVAAGQSVRLYEQLPGVKARIPVVADVDGDGVAKSKPNRGESSGGVAGTTVLGDAAGVPLVAAPPVPAMTPAPRILADAVTEPPAETAPAAKGVDVLPVPAAPPAVQTIAASAQRIIRNGQMEFEVDRFDAAFAQVSKLTTESGGYVGTTDSEKLPNGKVKGTVIVRVPPDRLDALVLQLRGIGDLKSQKLDANDVTKQYTDLESSLRAARAMEERLLGIIKDGKGLIKDLLAAEKELGVWREKIEQIVGEMRYLDNQVSLSTLKVTLYERDIRTPATAQETENIDAGMEANDVEKARTDTLKAIEEAKGRVIQSDLKRYDAGQFGATIVAEVPPDHAGPLLDRLKQIGKVARLDIQRKQTSDPNADANAPLKVEKKFTRLNLSLYNLANVAPRTTSTLALAAEDVEKTYRAILERVTKANGRVVSSNLSRSKPEEANGVMTFEIPAADADAVLNEVRAMGQVINLSVTDNADTQNSTAAKRGFSLQIAPLTSVPPREVSAFTIETGDVDRAMAELQAVVNDAGGRILESNLNKDRDGSTRGTLSFEVALDKAAGLIGKAKGAGPVRAAQSSKNLQVPAGALAKAKVDLALISPDSIVDAGTGPLATIRNGLATSVRALLWSLQLVVIGFCTVVPFAMILWAIWKLIKRRKSASVQA